MLFVYSVERGLFLIMFFYTQEKGNVPYVVDNGAGIFTQSANETGRIVAEWFSTKTEELQRMSQNALKLAKPNAVFDIVKDINDLVRQRRPVFENQYLSPPPSFSGLI